MASPSLKKERAALAQLALPLAHGDPASLLWRLCGPERRLTPRELVRIWKDAAHDPRAGEGAWNFYVHVPYCKSICTFCNYKRLRVSSRAALDEYVGFVSNEARLLAGPLSSLTFGSLFVGGGTPSVLGAAQLDELLGALHRHFRFAEGAEKTFEYDPMVMTEERFRVLSRFGFQRFTFGIQSLDVKVSELHGRGRQERRHIDRQFALLAKHQVQGTNVDFLLGLAKTTPGGMIAEIDEVLRTKRPHEMSLYFLAPTQVYVDRHFGGDFALFQEFLRPFEDAVPPAVRHLAAELGYAVRAGKHDLHLIDRRAKPRPMDARVPYSYSDLPSQVHRPLYLLGLGDSARSHIFGRLLYRAEHDTLDRDEDSPRYVGVDLSFEDEMFGYVAQSFWDADVLSRADFRRTFGADIAEAFPEALDKLVSLGVAEIHKDVVALTPQTRKDRLRDVLFFCPRARRTDLRSHGTRRVLPGGWRVVAVRPGEVEIARHGTRVLVRLLEPPGTHPAFLTTSRYDVQYQVLAGRPKDLERPLSALAEEPS